MEYIYFQLQQLGTHNIVTYNCSPNCKQTVPFSAFPSPKKATLDAPYNRCFKFQLYLFLWSCSHETRVHRSRISENWNVQVKYLSKDSHKFLKLLHLLMPRKQFSIQEYFSTGHSGNPYVVTDNLENHRAKTIRRLR